jgi:catechol 2,3-dioxygenase-like lactoylglutathione lyase family enzyme
VRDGLLGAGDLFHTGVVVPDLEEALERFGALLGLSFTDVVVTPVCHQRPHGIDDVTMRVAYSTGPAPHLEVIEAIPDSLFALRPDRTGLHHFGVWVDDMEAEGARLEALGMPQVAALVRDDGGPSLITFHAGPTGEQLELCDSSMRPGFQAWISGGEYPGN